MTFLALFTLFTLNTQLPKQSPKPEAWVLIVDPGADLFTRFGHSAFYLRMPDGAQSVYDFGVFDFDKEFIVRFLKGTAKYYLDKRELEDFTESYQKERREIRAHLLNLSPQKVRELESILESIFHSEERSYRYHHFSNNCATQMLGILSRLFKGDVEHNLRRIPIVPWRTNLGTVLGEYTILNWTLRLILSSELDAKRSAWTGSFLPHLLEKSLQSVFISENPFGKKIPLIKKTIVLSPGVNHLERLSTPWWFIAFSLFFLSLLIAPLPLRRRPIFFRTALILYGVFSLLLFSALFFLHLHLDICAYNLNMLAFFPILLLLLPFTRGPHLMTRRTLTFLIISAFFPLLEIFLRFFTIQKTSPFPEIAFTIHALFFIEWWALSRKKEAPEEDKKEAPEDKDDANELEAKPVAVAEPQK